MGMNWIELVRARIAANLKHMNPARAEAVLNEEMERVIADTEAGRAFGAKPREGDPDWTPDMAVPIVPDDLPAPGEDDPITSRGEKLSELRARARAEHEPWRKLIKAAKE
jgi:hypothetical protein